MCFDQFWRVTSVSDGALAHIQWKAHTLGEELRIGKSTSSREITRYYPEKITTKKSNLCHPRKNKQTMRHMQSVYVHKHTLFSTAQNGMGTLCFGTTQDIPAGLYQPEFQDTASLSYRATVPAKNTHRHKHTCTQPDTHTLMSTLTTSQQRQRRLIQTEG